MSKHGLSFSIEGIEVSVDDMGEYVATHVFKLHSEWEQEQMSHDVAHAIMKCVAERITMAQGAQSRAGWVHRHPPNHAGYYYCHLCGGWVHQNEAELDEIVPRSIRTRGDPLRDENRRMAHKWPVRAPDGKEICPGNQGKGSRQLPSKTLEIAPPDEGA